MTISGGEADGVTVEVVNRRPVAAGGAAPGSGGPGRPGGTGVLLGGAFDAEPTPDGGWRCARGCRGRPASAGERGGAAVIRALIVDDEALVRAGCG